MNNILYLDDYINLYNKKKNIIIKYKPYKDTLKYGKIINKKRFIKIYNKLLNEYKINNNLFNESIVIIINPFYSIDDKNNLKTIFSDLNYFRIKLINEKILFNINNDLYINSNDSYYYIFNNSVKLLYDNNEINNININNIINYIKNDSIIIFGKSINTFTHILDNYYVFEDNEQLVIKKYVEFCRTN